MGGGLGFLNKKSWHTGGMRQQEEVWKREQEYAKEQRKLEDLRKQIQEERKREELDEVAMAGGHKQCAAPPYPGADPGPPHRRTSPFPPPCACITASSCQHPHVSHGERRGSYIELQVVVGHHWVWVGLSEKPSLRMGQEICARASTNYAAAVLFI